MSYKVIIADDEPLTLIGLESLIDWNKAGFEIVGQAKNGKELSEEINKKHPDLVITDIKMPIKSGLDVIEETLAIEKEDAPFFIVLTSYEEFELARKAISLDVVEYLVKLELTEDSLIATLAKVKEMLKEKSIKTTTPFSSESHVGNELLVEKFFIRQFFHLGYNEMPLEMQIKNLDLDVDYPYFVVAFISIGKLATVNGNRASLSYASMKLAGDTASRYIPCHTTSLDMDHFAITFMLTDGEKEGYTNLIFTALRASIENCKKFLSVDMKAGVGYIVDDIRYLSESFSSAKAQCSTANDINTIAFSRKSNKGSYYEDQVDLSPYIKRLKTGFENVELEDINKILDELSAQLRKPGVSRLNAIDASSNVLYMITSMINDGTEILEEIFPSDTVKHGYRILYQAKNSNECADFLQQLSEGLLKALQERKKDYRMQTIEKIKSYINENITRRLTLSEVSNLFGYSQGYLSSIFSKYTGVSFVDYVATAKIQKAKEMLGYSDAMIYEVAQELGFESPFYFSKVFKKVTGISPSDYIQRTRRIKDES